MILYNIVKSNTTPTASNDLFTIIGNATRSYGITEIDIQGAGNTSQYTETAFYSVTTAGITGSAAITPTPANPASPAFGGLVYTAWSTQPVVNKLLQTCPPNSNGGRYYWRAQNNLMDALWSPGGNNAAASTSFRPVTINGAITARVKVGEI